MAAAPGGVMSAVSYILWAVIFIACGINVEALW